MAVENLKEPGFYQVTGYFGYRETQISMIDLLKQIEPSLHVRYATLDKVCFYLSSETIHSDKRRWIGHRYFIKFFSVLQRVSITSSATYFKLSFTIAKYFKIPSKAQIVVGTELEL